MKLAQNTAVTFDKLTHSYWLEDGTELLGVTSLMRLHGLGADYGSVDQSTLEAKAAKGTAVHELLEDYDNGKPCNPEEQYLKDALEAHKALGLPVIASEYLISDNTTVASSIDKVLSTDSRNKVDLVDVKTTYKVHEGPLSWQLSIYAYLFELQNPRIKVRNLYCEHIDLKTGEGKMIEVARLPKEKVEELIECQRNGEKYSDEAPELTEDIAGDVEALIASEKKIAMLKSMLAEEEGKIAMQRESIYLYMVEHKTPILGCKAGVYSLKKPSTRTGFDIKAFKADHPDYSKLVEQYTKTTPVKGSISFKVNA